MFSDGRLFCRNRVQFWRWGNDIDLIPLYRGFESSVWLRLRGIVHLVSLQWMTLLLSDLRNRLVLWAIVVNDGVVVGDIGDVRCPIDDRYVLLSRYVVSSVGWSPEIVETDERKRYWTNIEVAIAPRRYASADANGAFGGSGAQPQ